MLERPRLSYVSHEILKSNFKCVKGDLLNLLEASTGIEPVYTDLQSAASPLRQLAIRGVRQRTLKTDVKLLLTSESYLSQSYFLFF